MKNYQKLHQNKLVLNGVLVAFAGVDGSGKTTHARLLSDWLNTLNVPVLLTKVELNATYSVRKLAYEEFGDPAAYHPYVPALLREFVMACDLVSHCDNVIKKEVANGKFVIWDRGPAFCYKAYSLGYGLRSKWLDHLYDLTPTPDITFILDLPISISHKRLKMRSHPKIQVDENPRYLSKVSKHLRSLSSLQKNVVVLNASDSIESIHEVIRENIIRLFSNKKTENYPV